MTFDQKIHSKPLIVLKLGTGTLTLGRDRISKGKLEDIATQIKSLRSDYDVVIVSSGAIAAALQFLTLHQDTEHLEGKQALSAVGQPYLMGMYREIFADQGLHVGQCLLTSTDFSNPTSKQNIQNTISALLQSGIIPIVNENDTVSTDEIQFGDNDMLSAQTAVVLNADRLILATNTDGIYDDTGTTVAEILDLSVVEKWIRAEQSVQGTGGMRSKIDAAAFAQQAGIEVWIINGREEDFVERADSGVTQFTRIVP